MGKLIDTIYWEDFKLYYSRAAKLQTINISSPHGRDTSEPLHVDDPLQHYVTIYDTVDRQFAGFSNAIQQIWYAGKNPKAWQRDLRFENYPIDTEAWFFLFLIHRVTGSGASFSHDHGFRNSILSDMAMACSTASDMQKYVLLELKSGRAIFTSIGNQIPCFPKPPAGMRASEYYIRDYMPTLVQDVCMELNQNPRKYSIREMVDWINNWHRARSLKCFHFVMTAFVMDIAEYFPEYIDPYSRVNYGKNAVEALSLIFTNEGYKKNDFLDAAMDRICEEFRSPFDADDLLRNSGKAMSLEDVACDYVRYVENYVPRGYETLEKWQVTNNSLIPDHPKHQSYLKHIGGQNV